MPQNPCQTALSTLVFLPANCAKQRTFPNAFPFPPKLLHFSATNRPVFPYSERTFLSFARLNPAWAAKTGDRRRPFSAGCPAGQTTASRTPHPNRAALPPPLDRETPAPGISPSVCTLKTTPPAFPAWKKAPGSTRRPLNGFWFIPRSVPFPAGTPGRCHRVPHRPRRPAGSSPASRRR